jgi:hypothetical protein
VTGRTAAQDYAAIYQDTGRVYLLNVPALMLAVCEHLSNWRATYGERVTYTRNARGGSSPTPVVYVPMPVLRDAIRRVSHTEG